jgi:hypothetical protein
MCFLSFYLMRVMQKILQDCLIELSHEEIMDNLNEIRLIEMQTEGRKILMRTEIEGINNKNIEGIGSKNSFIHSKRRCSGVKIFCLYNILILLIF